MAYKVLYRKYRPKTFDDVVGQDSITKTLRHEITSGRIAHAYLFTGSRGTGKTTCAKILAKAVNCLNPVEGDPCGNCQNCIGIENGSVMDVMEIDAAGNNRVDDVRSLIEEVAFTPATAKYRVYIIDEVHELSQAAFNALLKTLEEPPPHAIFILATTEVHKLLATILSRCQRFDFRRITPENIADRLEYVCSLEEVTIEREAALSIARIADGALRDALSILDQCIGRSKDISLSVVEEAAGIMSTEHLYKFAQSIIDKNSSSALELISDLHSRSKDLSKLCEELITHFRHLMLIKTLGDKTDLIQVSAKEKLSLSELSKQISLSDILHVIDAFQISLDKMRYANQRIELEMTLIKLCSPELDDSLSSLIRRVEVLEQRKYSSPPPTASAVKQTPKYASAEEPVKTTGTLDPAKLSVGAVEFKEWQEVIHYVKEFSMTVGMAFSNSKAYISKDYLLVDASPIAFEYLRTKAEYKDKLRSAIYNITGKNYKLGPYVKPQNEVNKDDPIEALAQKAKEAGIEVNIVE